MDYDSRRVRPTRKQSALRWLAPVALLGALAFAALALWSARHLHRERAELRLAPVHAARYAADNAAAGAPAGRRIVFFGDSRIQGWNPRPALGGAEVLWRGIGGETTVQMLHRFEQDVLALKPSAVVIQAGINDLVAGAVLGRREQVARDTIVNLSRFAASARADSIDVYLLTVLRPARAPLWRAPFWPAGVRESVDFVNGTLRGMAGEGVIVLDADGWLAGDSPRMPSGYASDTLHLNAAGYARLNELVEDALGTGPDAVQ